MVQIGNSWDEILAGEFEKEYYQKLREFLKRRVLHKTRISVHGEHIQGPEGDSI